MSGNITGQGCSPSQTCVQINARGGGGQNGNGANTQNAENSSQNTTPLAKQQESGRIAILLVRYAVARRGSELNDYRYNQPRLNKDFPKLKEAIYVLRTLRNGYLYVFFDNKLEAFSVNDNGELRSNGKVVDSKIKMEQDALTLPGDTKEVMLSFSQHEWTSRQRERILKNVNRCRVVQMQRFTLASPGDDAFPLVELGTQVEEYAGRASQYKWTDTVSSKIYNVDTRAFSLEKLAVKGQQVLALHDPLGITHDLGNLVLDQMESLRLYVDSEDRSRKKIIAEAIGRFYESRFAQNYYKENGSQRSAEDYLNNRAQTALPELKRMGRATSLAVARQFIVSRPTFNDGIDRFTKHVKEDDRLHFLEDYETRIKRYEQAIKNHRADRGAWLATIDKAESVKDLGASFATYDPDDNFDCMLREFAFCVCIRGTGALVASQNEWLDDWEVKLLGKWLSMSVDESPLWRAVLGYKTLRETVDGARDRFGDITAGTADIIEAIYKKFPVNIATEEIMRSIVSYTLLKPKQWNGAVLDVIDAKIGEIIGLAGNAKDIATIENGLMGRYGKFLKKETIPLDEFTRSLIDATRIPGVKREIERLHRTGRLKTDKFTIIQIIDLTKRTTQSPLGEKYPNPFHGWGSAGVSAFVVLINVTNLRMAIASFDKLKLQEWANTASAIAAMGSAIQGGLWAFRKAMPFSINKHVLIEKLVKVLLSRELTMLFGYGGAIATGFVLLTKSKDSVNDKDVDAGVYYAVAAATAVAGGFYLAAATSAALIATAPISWIVIGVILVAVSLFIENEGDKAVDQPIEIWLDECTWGKRNKPQAKRYLTLKQENEAMVKALYSPVAVIAEGEDRWEWDHYFTKLEILLPGYIPGDSELTVTLNNTRIPNMEFEETLRGRIYKYRYTRLKNEAKDGMTYHVSYRPSDAFDMNLELTVTLCKD